MRDIYYQSVGNPLQLDRLPKTQPSIEMLPPAPSGAKTLSQAISHCSKAIVIGLMVFVFYRSPGISWLEPYDLLFAIPTFFAGLIAVAYTGSARWLLHPVFHIAAVLLFLNYRTPWPFQILMVSGATALWVYCLGRHWTTICTASPMNRSAAYRLRARWESHLYLLSGLAAVLTGSILISDSFLLKCVIATLLLATLVVGAPDGMTTPPWKVAIEVVVSWLTHQAKPYPGLLQSPAGPDWHRRSLVLALVVISAATLVRWPGSPVPSISRWAQSRHESVLRQLEAREAGTLERFRHLSLPWATAFGSISALPVLLVWATAIALAMPLLADAAAQRDQSRNQDKRIENVLTDIRRSPNPHERESIYLGRVVADGSPVLVPRRLFGEHVHILGDSGSGKTSLFLCPTIEQLAMSGPCSIMGIDLKADTLEILATFFAVADAVKRIRGVDMPLKLFSNQPDMATFGFNAMRQPAWSKFDLRTRTDILCGANGLTYGTDYGPSFYSSCNAGIQHHTMKKFPHVDTFREMARCIGNVLTTAKRNELHTEIRRSGVHVHEVMKRLGDCKPLNVTDSPKFRPEVIEQAIDLASLFQTPQLVYCHLSTTLSPSGAPEIARLFTYMLLAAATKTKRNHPVYLVVDEFQRMVAANLEYMLQLARSMGVGLILANQAMEDLKTPTTNLIPAIEANCRIRNWFSVSSEDDQERLMRSGGLTVDYLTSRSVSTTHDGRQSTTYSRTEQVVNRIISNDISLTNDHPFRSFLRISRGGGYAQYGGLPVIIESDYHISQEEYERRKAFPWPQLPGSFVPGINDDDDCAGGVLTGSDPDNPDWTDEIIGEPIEPITDVDKEAIGRMFEAFQQSDASPETPSEE